MRFIAKYIPANPYREASITMKPYYRTIFADSINEASKLAERMTRKGYICKEVKQSFNDKE